MGGNIFKGMNRRYSEFEYLELYGEVMNKLGESIISPKFSPYYCMSAIKSYMKKESFGDMDIVVNSNYLLVDWIPSLVKEFNLPHGHWVKNGNIFSFLYKEFQIDLIISPTEDYQSSLDYFAWNDLGNLIGRITHKLGIKFGHDGSWIILRDGDYQIGKILVTKSIQDLLEFIGLDYPQWQAGFLTMEDAYLWLTKSKYFNKHIFDLDNRNHQARVRDAKRVNYTNFITWLESQDNLIEYPYESIVSRGGYNIREPFFALICEKFPHVLDEYNSIINTHEENKQFKQKFNGEIVHKLTGLENKELGEFMAWARKEIERTQIKHMFLKYTEHTCKLMIESLYFHYRHNQPYLRFNYQLAVKIARHEGLVQM